MGSDDKVNILVVDDLPDKLLALRAVLESLDENVITAESGREALRHLLHKDFAVILLDVNMPDIDGFETAAMIRQRKRSEHTPIIFITGYADEMHLARGYQLGAVDYIFSPVVPEVLRTKVGVFVELARKNRQIQKQAEQQVALARAEAARVAAEEATRRSNFLAEASTALAESLDLEATQRGLLRVVVPDLADMAGVTLVTEPGTPWHSELAWVDPPDTTLHTHAAAGQDGPDDELRAALDRVLVSGKAEFLSGLALANPFPRGNAAGRPQPSGQLRSAVILPLRARGRTLGALTLVQGESGRQFTPADLALAEDLAGRAAIALDNARLYRDIQEADRRKDEFLAMLAHELRNPLAPIRNALDILAQPNAGRADDAWARGVIARQMDHVVRLVDDLLDVSRITRGKINVRREPVDVAAVVAQAVETSRPLIEDRGHDFRVEMPPDPLFVEADPSRLAQVVSNLLNNAAKYTPEGGRIALDVAGDGCEVVFRVSDTGTGIPAEMLARIFEPFTQVERTLDRSQGGLGIGLTLVKSLVEMHGGRVEVHSDGPGSGSAFTVRLPLIATPAAAVPVHANGIGHAPHPARPARVLLVDDNIDVADTLAVLLRLAGHEVRVFRDGPSALAGVDGFPMDVAVLDIGLPKMSGYELARALRGRPEGRDAVLIALTGYGQEEDRRQAREAGFDHHLVKPVDPEYLKDLIASCARKATPEPSVP